MREVVGIGRVLLHVLGLGQAAGLQVEVERPGELFWLNNKA